MIKTLNTENSFNKLFRQASRGEENTMFLFTSPDYDTACRELLVELKRGNHRLKNKLYIVNSFLTPHAFAAHRTTKVPCLVSVINKERKSETYLPFIYERMGISLP
jgi:hypothetical protein